MNGNYIHNTINTNIVYGSQSLLAFGEAMNKAFLRVVEFYGLPLTPFEYNESIQTIQKFHLFGDPSTELKIANVYLQNEKITSEIKINGWNVYIGDKVTNSKPEGEVIVKDGAKLIVKSLKTVVIPSGFTIEQGGQLEIHP